MPSFQYKGSKTIPEKLYDIKAADLYKEAKFAEAGKYAVGLELDGEDATDGV